MKNKKWWPDRNDLNMCRWAYVYLQKQRYPIHKQKNESDYEACENLLNSIYTKAECDLLLRKMNNAWRQREYKKTQVGRGNSAHSYMLSERSHEELKFLAQESGKTYKELLERLIHKAYESRQKQLKKHSATTDYPPKPISHSWPSR